MNIVEIRCILDELETGVITWEQALVRVTALPKVWQTDEWRKRRAELLTDSCAVCETKTGPFVLQHITPTLSFKEMCLVVKDELRQQLLPQVDRGLTDEEVAAHVGPGDLRQACPHCGLLSIRHRPSMAPHYVCGRCTAGSQGFDQPAPAAYYAKQRTTNRAAALATAREFLVSKGTADKLWEYSQQIQHEATLRSLRQSLAYRSLADTATYCKPCAFKADKYLIQRKIAWGSKNAGFSAR